MKAAPLSPREDERVASLRRYEILDTPAEEAFDEIVRFASELCETPIALISLVDVDRQWFKSRVGLDAPETSRELAFCAHSILQSEVMEVPDAAADIRFADNPLVLEDPKIRFYAGAPLIGHEGHAVGTLCVIDRVPRRLNPLQRRGLLVLGRQVIARLELRSLLRRKTELLSEQEQLIRQLSSVPIISVAQGILLVPLFGTLDPARVSGVTGAVLAAVSTRRARNVIIDLTGVDAVDIASAEQIVRLSAALNLLGAPAILAGITPPVARSVASLDTDLRQVHTASNVAEALTHLRL